LWCWDRGSPDERPTEIEKLKLGVSVSARVSRMHPRMRRLLIDVPDVV
jgi:hypothetical protein